MSYDLSAKELKKTIALEPSARLSYFIEKVTATEELWTLAQGEALLVLGTDNNTQFVPVWPHADFALIWFEDSGIDEADLVAMNLNDWVESTFEELNGAEIEIDVFPSQDEDGIVMSASELAAMFAAKMATGA